MNMYVALKEDDPDFGMRKGEILEVEPADYDDEKYIVIRRVRDGFDPKCSIYRSQVTRVKRP